MDTLTKKPAPDLEAAAPSWGRLCGDPLETLSCLLQTLEDLNAAIDLEEALGRVARDLKRGIGFETFSVLLLDELGQELRFCFADGVDPEVVRHWRFGMGQGLVGTAAQSGEVVVVDDVRGDQRYISGHPEVRSEVALPLKRGNRTIGVLDVASREPGYFTSDHLRFLQLVASHMATAIENRQLYANQRRQAQLLSVLHEASRELAAILDRGKLLERLTELVHRHVDYHFFNVMLWDEGDQILEAVHVRRFGGAESEKCRLALGQGLCGTAAALRQSIRVPNVQIDPRYESCGDDRVRSELVVPLVFEDRLLGVLDLESHRYNAFSAEDEQFLATLASSVAIALENAQLYQRLREDEKRLSHDLETARGIQQYLLPKKTPWVPGLQLAVAYSPARHLGGDLYDVIAYGEDKTAIAVGDVAGKGTAAALYGSLVIGMLRGYAAESCDRPVEVLGYLNNELRQLRIDRRFLALTFAVYDRRRGVLTVANAGLPYPRLVQGGRVQELELAGVPLGAMGSPEYQEREVTLAPGDVLAFTSDGIEELLGAGHEAFGGERLDGVLAKLADGTARQIADGVMAATRRFLGDDAEPSDDRTVVVLKVTPPASEE